MEVTAWSLFLGDGLPKASIVCSGTLTACLWYIRPAQIKAKTLRPTILEQPAPPTSATQSIQSTQLNNATSLSAFDLTRLVAFYESELDRITADHRRARHEYGDYSPESVALRRYLCAEFTRIGKKQVQARQLLGALDPAVSASPSNNFATRANGHANGQMEAAR